MTTFAATALRLAAREVLAPYAAIQADAGFPTIARNRVYDSRTDFVDDLRGDDVSLPAISIYTPGQDGGERGPSQDSGTADWSIDLHFVIQMAVIDDDAGELNVMAAQTSAEAEANLDLLGTQIRYCLVGPHEYGSIFRTIAKRVTRVQSTAYYLPEMQLAIAQRHLVFTCLCDDPLRDDPGGLPKRAEMVRQRLPIGSDGRGYLDRIAAALDPVTRTPLGEIMIGADINKDMPPDFASAEVQGRTDTT